jgi:hypothetical protein
MHCRKQFTLPEIFHVYKTDSVVLISVALVVFEGVFFEK